VGTVIDPAISTPIALAGRVVTMDHNRTVRPHAVVYVRDGAIVAVLDEHEPPPEGFADVSVVHTRSTICPGLVELHNHLPYDVLSLWAVPKRFTNRDQWSSPATKDYHRLVSGPMGVLGRDPDVVPAIVRYVEMRCLLGGTTTSQGIALAVDPGIVRLFRGLVRNVESTGDRALPPATTHIADVDATDAERFLERLSGNQKLLLHLSEGTDVSAREHFLALQLPDRRWAITGNLIGIHCAAMNAQDFQVFAAHGGSMVWSPLSNLLLYGGTAAIGDALAAGVPVAIGSDWSPSGSKSLLGELKVARLAAAVAGVTITSAELLAMATCTPAAMLGWLPALGSIEAGKKADLIAVHGTAGDPYDAVVDADENDLDLVVINGIPRAGTRALMAELGYAGETVKIGRRKRVVNLAQETADPDVAAVSVAGAIGTLTQALHDLPNAGGATPNAVAATPMTAAAPGPARRQRHGRALLAASGVVHNGLTPRPHLPFRGRLTGANLPTGLDQPLVAMAAAAPAPLPALSLDPLTAVQNKGYWQVLAQEANLPPEIRDGLAGLAPH
jgi:5-methylthioadenosine/S-adenosylhomocysteine deaminase